jgi:hypothetical protein
MNAPVDSIFCDELTLASALAMWRQPRRGRLRVAILDPVSDSVLNRVLTRLLALAGVDVAEVPFFAGHLHMPDGQAVYVAARGGSIDLALHAGERLLQRTPLLRRLDETWGRRTIYKYLAGALQTEVQEITMRLLVTDALGRQSGFDRTRLLLKDRPEIDMAVFEAFAPDVDVALYRGATNDRWRQGRLAIPIFLLQILLYQCWAILKRRPRWRNTTPGMPSLLVLQEDDLSLDRSYRSQPHWLYSEDGVPPFRTIVLETSSVPRQAVNTEPLAAAGVERLWFRELWRLRGGDATLLRRIAQDFRAAMWLSMLGPAGARRPAIAAARLLHGAGCLARFCAAANVRTFMTGENYMLHADAMQLIAEPCDVVTISYQYANRVVKVVPQMLTSADIMVTMSPLFDQRWTDVPVKPRRCLHGGYLYDGAFARVRERAAAHRRGLRAAGAEFVICYFDEKVRLDKYGLIDVDDHVREVSALMDLVTDDESVGLVIKTQFQSNASRHFAALADRLHDLSASGRVLELGAGVNRNCVFPAEAALTADITIGQAYGATASLEAALAGTRSLVVNPYRVRSDHDSVYGQADIVFPSIDAALGAIRQYRDGRRPALGDWSPILDRFDPFRDGRAERRLRRWLERVTLNPASREVRWRLDEERLKTSA